MKKQAVISIYLLAGFLAAAVAWAYGTMIDVGIQTSGIVKPEGGVITIVSEAGGKIVRVQEREGAQVHQGDILVELDPRNLLIKKRLLESRIHLQPNLMSLYLKLEQVHLDLDQLTITSPVAGTVSSMSALHPGEVLAAGMAIAQVTPQEGELVIESWLPANKANLVREGQRVRVRPESGDSFDGDVISISPMYRVVVRPARFAPPICAGMTVQVHFVARQQRLLWLLFD